MSKTYTVLFLFALTACGGAKNDDSGGPSDEALAAGLWAAMDGYTSWNQISTWEGIQPSHDGTHGAYVQIWADDDALAALEAGEPVPDGAILVKEGYSDVDGTPTGTLTAPRVTAMQKIEGYAPDDGDWFWARYFGDTGEIDSIAGQSSACTGCHSADPDADYVWFDDVEPSAE